MVTYCQTIQVAFCGTSNDLRSIETLARNHRNWNAQILSRAVLKVAVTAGWENHVIQRLSVGQAAFL